MAVEAETTEDAALGGRLILRQPRRGHLFGHDAILLAAAADACPGEIKTILYRAAERRKIKVTLVANALLRIPASKFVDFLRVEGGANVADRRIVELLTAGDLVIIIGNDLSSDAQAAIAGAAANFVSDNRRVLIHPLAKYKTTKLSAIIGQKFIAFEPDIPTRKAIDRVLKDHNVTVQPVMEFDNIETVKRAVEIDAGIAIVPQGTIMQEVAKQTLAAVQFEDAQFFRQLAAVYKKNKVLSPAMKQFVAILKESQ